MNHEKNCREKTSPKPPSTIARQRALVVGVSNYPAPEDRLPAVAADVKAMASLLSSKNGIFPTGGVKVLSEKQAVRTAVLAALREAFVGAKAMQTVFIYLAGHGTVEGGEYYFCPYDAQSGRMAETGVPLLEIKRMFDQTASRRVFLWMDFCHSGGILARGRTVDDVAAIRRAIGVVSGQGKVIVAACTREQSAYEDPKIGHGLFTHALLRGLKGEAKSAQGEVTAHSLYEFIDHQVANSRQQPIFFGETAGRIVLMHYPARSVAGTATGTAAKLAKPTPPTKTQTAGRINTSGNLLLLDGRIYTARQLNERNDGGIEVQIISKSGEEDTALRGLRGDRYSHSRKVSFAFRSQAFTAQVEEVSASTAGTRPVWSITLQQAKEQNNYAWQSGYNGLSVQDLAEMRARFLLLNEKPAAERGMAESMLLSFVQGRLKDLGVNEAVFIGLWKRLKTQPATFLRASRLWALYYLLEGGVCDDVIELRLGPIGAGKLAVRLRGSRKSQYSGTSPHEVLVEGYCKLT